MDSIRQKRLLRLLVASKVLLLALGCFMASNLLVMDDDVIVKDNMHAYLINWEMVNMFMFIEIYKRNIWNVRGELLHTFEYHNVSPREIIEVKGYAYGDVVIDIHIAFYKGQVIMFKDFKMTPGKSYWFVQGEGNIPVLIDTPEVFR